MTSPTKQGTARWVKVAGLLALLILFGLVIRHLTGHGFHHH